MDDRWLGFSVGLDRFENLLGRTCIEASVMRLLLVNDGSYSRTLLLARDETAEIDIIKIRRFCGDT